MVSNTACNLYLLTWSLKESFVVIDSCVYARNSPLILDPKGSSTPCFKPAKPWPPPVSSLLLPPCLCPSDACLPDSLLLAGLMAGQKEQTQGLFMFLPTAGAESVLSRSTKLNRPNKSLILPNKGTSNHITHAVSNGFPVWVILHSSPWDT